MCRQCPYCGEPVIGEAGIEYGGEVMHAICYVNFNDEMAAIYSDVEPPIDFDLVPELVDAAFPNFVYHEGYEDDHVEADAVLV